MTQPGMSRQIVIDGAQIIDGTGRPAMPDGRVTIAGDRIIAAGPRDTVQIPDGAEVISGEGRTVLPGLIDVHVHVPTDGNMALYVRNGVTSIRFSGGNQSMLLKLRERIQSHEIPGPRVFSVGPLVDATPHAWPGSAAADSPIEARRLVKRLVEVEQVDAILATHSVTRPVLEALVEAAHALAVPVTGQIWQSDARDAIAAGMDGLDNTSRIAESDAYPEESILGHHSVSKRIGILAHMWAEANWESTTEIAHQMAEKGMFLAPELVSFEAWTGARDADMKADRDWPEYGTPPMVAGFEQHNKFITQDWGQEEFTAMAEAIDKYREFCGIFYKAGGLLVTGTDLSFGGIALHRELWNFEQAGLSALQVIRAATRQAASALGRDDLGHLMPGRLADMIVVDGDPTKDLKALRNVQYTFVNGHAVVREGIVQNSVSSAD